MDLSRGSDFDLVFDLSPATLTDGCIGLISLTCDNAVSKLSITFGDVYLGNDYAATLTGDYVADDSYLLDYSLDPACTSLDMTGVNALPAALPWLGGNNRIVYVPEGSTLTGTNLVAGSVCQNLLLSESGGDFHPVRSFTAEQAKIVLTVEGLRLTMLPFTAVIPEGVRAYTLGDDFALLQMRSIPAHQPVLLEGNGTFEFLGSGEISYSSTALTASLRGSYSALPLYAGDYVLAQQGGQWGFARLSQTATLAPFGVYAQSASAAEFIPLDLSATGIVAVRTADGISQPVYNLMGQKVSVSQRGLLIRNGRKYLNK